MKRAVDRAVNPNIWSGVGGKVEPCEINDPYAACIREIEEETGLTSCDIKGLTLRYVVLRRRENVITQSYIYFGQTTSRQFADSDEGLLYWIPKEDLLSKQYTPTYAEMMRHYLSDASDPNAVFVGVSEKRNDALHMMWTRIEDYER